MKKVRFGIAGAGAIVRECHLPVMATNPRVQVAAACSTNQTALSSLAQQFGIPRIYSDFNDMAGDPEIDAVLVALPNSLHAAVSISIMRAGKSVLCEKPMARTIEEARRMLQSAEEAGSKLGIAHPWRCDEDYRWLRDVVRSGRLGKIFKARGHAILTGGSPSLSGWRGQREMAGGGALTDLGIHLIDTISFLFQDELQVRSVLARTGNYFTTAEVEDTATAIFECDNGLEVIIEAGWHHNFQNSPHGAIELFGTEGYARTFPTEMFSKVEGAWGRYQPNLHPARPHIDLSMYAAQIDAFVDCVLSGAQLPCDGRQGLRNLVWLEAAYESARKRELLPFSDAIEFAGPAYERKPGG